MEKLKEDILKLIDPANNQTLKDNNALSFIGLDEENDIVKLEILVDKKIPETENLKKDIIKLVKIKYQHRGIKLDISEKKVFNSIFSNPNVKVIGIISGKGGVGKSSVAVNIAYRLMKKGYNVALIDADIYGSSIPELLDIPHQTVFADEEENIIPIKYENMEIISTAFFTEHHEPVIWRGSMLNSMLDYFFYKTAWRKNTNVVIIDFPPGTGDIMLDINQFTKNASMLLVTTPHLASATVSIKAGLAALKMGQKIIGVIENLSYYIDPETLKKHYIFGQTGGIKAAQEVNAELIAQIPIEEPKTNNCLFNIEQNAGKAIEDIVDYLIFNLDIKK